MTSINRSLLIICILGLIVSVCGCTTNSNNSKDTISSDRYVAVLEEYTNQSTLIGTPPYTPVRPMPIPTPGPVLDFDNSLGYTTIYMEENKLAPNDSFKVLILKEYLVDTPTSTGYAGQMEVNGVYNLPYTVEDGFIIENITSNGTIMALCKNQSIVMRPGENATIVMSSVNTTGAYLANTVNNNTYDYFNTTVMPWPVTNEQVYKFTNEGTFNISVLK